MNSDPCYISRTSVFLASPEYFPSKTHKTRIASEIIQFETLSTFNNIPIIYFLLTLIIINDYSIKNLHY